MSFYMGLMSGTSMDGIDAALVQLPEQRLVCGLTKKYSSELQNLLRSLIDERDLSLSLICQVNTLIGREFAAAANELLEKARLTSKDIKAIGSHGQTVCHNTSSSIPYTMQLGCPHTISSLTGITVVADFRTRDLVHGGQGAPFAPLYHQQLFSKYNRPIAVVNVGGIANISLIFPDKPTMGWDIGPGNCLMDAWTQKCLGKPYDEAGLWAREGKVIPDVLDRLLSDAFFSLEPPKSIGKEYFSLDWFESYLWSHYEERDIQATLMALTAHSIIKAILAQQEPVQEVYFCGGGSHNLHLLQLITELLPGVLVQCTDKVGVDPDFLEAMMCAWLAEQTLSHIPLDLRAITGSKKPEILGAIYPMYRN